MEYIYIVKYYKEEFDTISIFVTHDKKTAIKYVKKFNSILKKWKKYYSQYEDRTSGITWIKDVYVNKYFERWYKISEISNCFYDKIELR